ncbi:MAG: 4-alpha-glucanotransferase [Thermomicrobiales bacterium]
MSTRRNMTRTHSYHAYVQWIADQQIDDLPHLSDPQAGSLGVGLYLDLPIGVNGDGYDVWREPSLRNRVQRWRAARPAGSHRAGLGFPPLHPQKLQEDGYRHYIEIIRHHMRHASLLRVMTTSWAFTGFSGFRRAESRKTASTSTIRRTTSTRF